MFRKRASLMIPHVLTLAPGGGHYYYDNVHLPVQQPTEPAITTTRVPRGDLTITAMGSPDDERCMVARATRVFAEGKQ